MLTPIYFSPLAACCQEQTTSLGEILLLTKLWVKASAREQTRQELVWMWEQLNLFGSYSRFALHGW